jgi:hypothetical protein
MLQTDNHVENAPAASWNYRVIEFVTGDEGPWRSIHEVHYNNGVPTSYSETPAAVTWCTNEGEATPLVILERMREAVAKSVLTEKDFHTSDSDDSEIISTQLPWQVVHVKALDGFRLRVSFVDGLEGDVDMSALVHSPSAGVFAQLANPSVFAEVFVEHGAVTWPGELDFAPDAMYREIKHNGTWNLA